MPEEELMGFYEELFVNVKLDKEVLFSIGFFVVLFRLRFSGRPSSTDSSTFSVRSKFGDNRRFTGNRSVYISSYN